MKRQAERDASPSRALGKRQREREQNPPLAMLLAETKTYHRRSRSRERERPRAREEREGLQQRAHHEQNMLGRAPLRTTAVLPKAKTPSAETAGARLEYKTLLISNLGSQVSDEHVEDGLFHEFKKFGEMSVKLSHTPELGRIAYVNFRRTEHAREARHAKSRLVLYDRPLKVEPMYMRRRSVTPPDVSNYASLHTAAYAYRQRSLSPGAGSSALRDMRPRHYVDGMGLSRDRVLEYYTALEERSRAFAYTLPEDDLKPEDDQRATRNLFIGNLDHTVSELDLRQGFDKYGIIEEVIIKRPARGQGGVYGFLKFQNLDMALRAKVAMQGRMINGNQIKIGYGKVNPTTRLWVGGLGPNTSLAALAREFDRFGSIRTIDYVKGDNFAYIHYESLDAAQAACTQMRGFPLGGPNRRLRVDFAKAEEARAYPQQYQPPLVPPPHYDLLTEGYGRHRSLERELRARARSPTHSLFTERDRLLEQDWSPTKVLERRANPETFGRIRQHSRSRSRERWIKERDLERGAVKNCDERRKRRSLSPIELPVEEHVRSKVRTGMPSTPEDSPDRGRGRLPDSTSDPLDHTPDIRRHSSGERPIHEDPSHPRKEERGRSHRKTESTPDSQMDKSKTDSKNPSTLSEYAQTLSRVWHGSLVLKNSCFPANLHILEGSASFLLSLMRDNQAGGSKITQLKIAQRLRLDQPKLDEVTRRIKLGGPDGYSVLLAVQGAMDREHIPPPEPGFQQRLLRNLVTYLRNKQAAGVIGLPLGGPKEREMGGMLYAFPPCDFSEQFLQSALKTVGKLEEEHLLIIVVRDTT